MHWPKERQVELERMKLEGKSLEEIAQAVGPGTSIKTVSYHLKHVKSGVRVPKRRESVIPDYPQELLHVPDVPCALTSDWHSPYYSELWLERLIAVCKALEIKDLAIVGDLMDFKWVSKYSVKDMRGSLADDFEITFRLMEFLLEFFEHIWWVYGNHDDRFQVVLKGQDILPTLFNHALKGTPGKLHISPCRSMLLGQTWQLEHPRTFSHDGAKVAVELCAIEHKNIAAGHAHHFGFKYDVSGQYVGIDLGGMFDITLQEYLYKAGVTNMPKWVNGFWVYLGNGLIRPFENRFVDWRDFSAD